MTTHEIAPQSANLPPQPAKPVQDKLTNHMSVNTVSSDHAALVRCQKCHSPRMYIQVASWSYKYYSWFRTRFRAHPVASSTVRAAPVASVRSAVRAYPFRATTWLRHARQHCAMWVTQVCCTINGDISVPEWAKNNSDSHRCPESKSVSSIMGEWHSIGHLKHRSWSTHIRMERMMIHTHTYGKNDANYQDGFS